MRLYAMSDTHFGDVDPSKFPIQPRDDDVLVHTGDATMRGTLEEFSAFLHWFSKIPTKHKLFVPGNHDFLCEKSPGIARAMCDDAGVTLLDGLRVELCGVSFYGAPWVTNLRRWAFHREDKWIKYRVLNDLRGVGVDVLLTHSPAYGTLDRCVSGDVVGVKAFNTINERFQPLAHVHGHIHESYGRTASPVSPGTGVYNVSLCDEKYQVVNSPVVIPLLRSNRT